MKYKAVVTDVDGTLLNSDGSLSEFSQEVLKEYVSKGGHLILATGKLFKSIRPLCKEFSLTSKQIAGNGALIVDPVTERITILSKMDPSSVKSIIEILKKRKIEFVLYKSNSIHYEEGKIKEFNLNLIIKGGEGELLTSKNYNNWEGVIKILSFITDPSQEKIVREEVVGTCKGIKVFRTSPYYLEFTKKGTSKFNALKRVLKELKIGLESVVAFGDQENDIELLKKAEIGVAVENAPFKLKDVTDYVTASCDDDGVANFIHRFILKEDRAVQK